MGGRSPHASNELFIMSTTFIIHALLKNLIRSLDPLYMGASIFLETRYKESS